ncbi:MULTISPECIES: fimbrial biogenesis chaperone [Pantoea]|jgi:chaperone protein EcpD|uniref:Fimbria/pilus periplasmic chaperone n=1 Tax=Pantoea leporis TaxID=2933780 RepID=A0ABV2DY71_9GAMM|nr:MULTISPECIES: fimbria/pilus periplasmic chaperone [Pantoea]WGK59610.1 fimbria/pilus periplasmic chaperone [Pantoea sp. SS70]
MNISRNKTLPFFALLWATLMSGQALASIVITGTRVIYHQDDKEVSVQLKNVGASPVLIQSWVDNGDANATPENIQTPYIITPPVNRVDAGKGQTLRLSLSNSGAFAHDRESVSWLNVLEIPAKTKDKAELNTLQMAFRTRIKLFYRPAGLKGDANEAVKSLNWSVSNGQLKASNPTPYNVSLVTVTVNGRTIDGEMVPPLSSLTFKISASAGANVSGDYVNDFGAVQPFTAAIK